jgi:hypothetical protein
LAKGTVVLAIGAIGGFVLTSLSLKDTRTQFRDTERPWVGLVDTEVDSYPTDSNIAVTVTFENTGKSPAEEEWLRAFTLAPLDSLSDKQTTETCHEKPTDAGVGSVLLPGQSRQVPIFSETLESGTVEWIREQLGQKPKPEHPVDLHPQGIILTGCIDYMWNNRCYRTRFCQQYSAVVKPQRPFGVFTCCNFDNDPDENGNCKQR